MSLSQTALHLVNLGLFLYACINYGRATRMVWRSKITPFVKEYMIKESLAGIAVALIFVVMQADWIINEYNEAVGNPTSWGWLLFDYALAMYLLWNGDRVRNYCLIERRECPVICWEKE